MYLVRTPSLVKPLARDFVWSIPTSEQELYITFDDGPTPGVTDTALDILKKYEAKATFFCLGKNVVEHPALYQRILNEGHSIGNHSWDHPDGWKTSDISYLKNALRAGQHIQSGLFRPPYGRITLSQAKALRKKYQLIMWTVLSADFDPAVSPEKCLTNVLSNIDNGSIIVFHDSLKAKKNMLYALEESLKFFCEEGYTLRPITSP
ncbi:MAG: polysaccharide deacetylase family protein [Flavobacteriales bacterium]|jgi:peptidoglycan/xylan/chitin deacetylase (PgdA/CDA1 family)|nr:polysaccharide deacetylase family protein [Flavobacteriales bacterium]